MAFEQRVTLPGSERKPVAGATEVSAIGKDETVHVTVVLQRKGAGPHQATGHEPQKIHTHEEFAQTHGADPAVIELVEEFAHEYGLTVAGASVAKRTVNLTGTAQAMESAFHAALHCFHLPDQPHDFRGRTGAISIPVEMQDKVIAILGMDTRPIAKPHFRAAKLAAPAGSFTPPQVAQLYNYPKNVTGAGQTIGIIELGGGYKSKDLTTYFKGLGIKTPKVYAISVDGGKNQSGTNADGEVLLDIEVAGAIAPGAKIAVYFAPNTDQGFVDAITNAVHDTVHKPSVISISWGASEDDWTEQARTAMNAALQDAAALGVTVTVAAGDNGSTDGAPDGKLHVDFPASSPFALSCGGTKLAGTGSSIGSEVVWNELAKNEGATGGGVSKYFAIPSYQSAAGVPVHPETGFAGRGVPDVAGDADPESGFFVRVDGQNTVIGGTSAVSPLWAALIALANQANGTPMGFPHPILYQNPAAFFDIVTGGNGNYNAGPGWDACTGLGSPNGTAVTAAFAKKA